LIEFRIIQKQNYLEPENKILFINLIKNSGSISGLSLIIEVINFTGTPAPEDVLS
jgi:hypothetical protein